jgi:hypothetical protein
MKRLLYLLRQPVATIHEALFDPSQPGTNIVFLSNEREHPMMSSAEGQIFSIHESDIHSKISFDDLVEKIFECESTIVI